MKKIAPAQILVFVAFAAFVIVSSFCVSVNSTRSVASEVPATLTTPALLILSPENKTYEANDVQLSIVVDPPNARSGYGLGGEKNVTFSGNTTLTDLPNGVHQLIVYLFDMGGEALSSKTIKFEISQPDAPSAASIAYASFGPVGCFAIRSPLNFTKNSSPVVLNVTGQVGVGTNLKLSMSYSLDGQERMPFPFVLEQAHEWNPFIGIIVGSVILSQLSEGSHSVTVYGNLELNSSPNLAQSTVYFDIMSN